MDLVMTYENAHKNIPSVQYLLYQSTNKPSNIWVVLQTVVSSTTQCVRRKSTKYVARTVTRGNILHCAVFCPHPQCSESPVSSRPTKLFVRVGLFVGLESAVTWGESAWWWTDGRQTHDKHETHVRRSSSTCRHFQACLPQRLGLKTNWPHQEIHFEN